VKLFIKTYSYLDIEYEAKIQDLSGTSGTYFVIELICNEHLLYMKETTEYLNQIESNFNQMLRDFNKKIKQKYATDFENLMERLEFEQKF
jgi:hypothetical protein